MVIDAHYHPIFISEICESEEKAEHRRQTLAYYKASTSPLKHAIERLECSGVDKCFLLPHDYTTITNDAITDEEIKKLVDLGNGRFYGFTSVDPNSDNVLEKLEYAFKTLNLSGLKLHPSRQKFYPNDEKMFSIYELCVKYNKPIIFHSGFSWEPDALAQYSRPINFEQVAATFPTLRFCLAHFGFPWVMETAMLMLKYPNVYADTALLYFDSSQEFYEHIFTKTLGIGWIDRSLRHQIMYGSNTPRFEQMRMLRAIQNLGLRQDTVKRIICENALKFIGEGE